MFQCLILILFCSLPNREATQVVIVINDLDDNTKTQITHVENEGWTNNNGKQDTNKPDLKTVDTKDSRQTNADLVSGDITDITQNTNHDLITHADYNDKNSPKTLNRAETTKTNNNEYKTEKTKDEKENMIKGVDIFDILKRGNVNLEIKVKTDNETIDIDRRNDSMKAIKLRRALDDSKLNKFLARLYNSSVNSFNNLREDLDMYINDDVEDAIDLAIETFRDEYKKRVKNLGKTASDLDKVLVILESMYLVKRISDDLVPLIILQTLQSSTPGRIQKIVRRSFDMLLDEQNEYICIEFNVCRSAGTFRMFFAKLIDVIMKGSDEKIASAFDSFMKVFGKSQPHVMKEYMKTDPDLRKDLARVTWRLLKDGLRDPNELYQEAAADGQKEIKNGALDAIPANAENVALWTNITISIRQFIRGKIKDAQPIFQTLSKHLESNMPLILAERVTANSTYLTFYNN